MSHAKTPAQRQAAKRARDKTAAGGPEVRGIYAPKPAHAPIREAAAVVLRKMQKEQKP